MLTIEFHVKVYGPLWEVEAILRKDKRKIDRYVNWLPLNEIPDFIKRVTIGYQKSHGLEVYV